MNLFCQYSASAPPSRFIPRRRGKNWASRGFF